jgi:adenine deaminase
MLTAARHAAAHGGGLVVAEGEQVTAEVPLPLGGLMSDRPIEEAPASTRRSPPRARRQPLHDPFMAMTSSPSRSSHLS